MHPSVKNCALNGAPTEVTTTVRTLPFLPKFIDPILKGEKDLTCRTKKYGEPGDLVNSPAGVLRIMSVEKIPLKFVAEALFRREGCSSPEDFIRVWEGIHPGVGFVPEQVVNCHQFEVAKRCAVCKGSGVCVECDGTGMEYVGEEQENADKDGFIICCECEGSEECIGCDGVGYEPSGWL